VCVRFPEYAKKLLNGHDITMAHDSENEHVLRQIDENLKRVYQQKLDEELPDRFKSLLDQLKKQDTGGEAK
jgi:hypothetical protein